MNAMLEFRYDTQPLIEGKDLDVDAIREGVLAASEGDSLVVAGDGELVKLHYHTNEPWSTLRFCAAQGEIFDIVVEDMDRQSRGLDG